MRAKDQFLSIAAHELRTPVAGVKGYAQMLLRAQTRDTLTAEKITHGLRTLDQVSDRLTSLTNDLLDVSGIRLGQLPLRPRPLPIVPLVREVAQRLSVGFGDRHPLQLVVPDELPAVVIDPDRIDQVLTNLLDNAAKYSPHGGPIKLSVEADNAGRGVLVTVRDQGIGLPAGTVDAIFEPFGRAENAIEQNLPGLGLGLYICRSIVERHGAGSGPRATATAKERRCVSGCPSRGRRRTQRAGGDLLDRYPLTWKLRLGQPVAPSGRGLRRFSSAT